MKKNKGPTRQRAHVQRLIDSGGRVLNVELSATASAALEYIKQRDRVTNRTAIEHALMFHAGIKGAK